MKRTRSRSGSKGDPSINAHSSSHFAYPNGKPAIVESYVMSDMPKPNKNDLDDEIIAPVTGGITLDRIVQRIEEHV